jgi:hypothetical protein
MLSPASQAENKDDKSYGCCQTVALISRNVGTLVGCHMLFDAVVSRVTNNVF